MLPVRVGPPPGDVTRCETEVSHLLTTSPAVVFLMAALSESGCTLRRRHVRCMACTDNQRFGGFHPSLGVALCSDVVTYGLAESTLVHELIHAYDHCRCARGAGAPHLRVCTRTPCRRDVDWRDLRHVACSEIRAAALSGECSYWNEFNRGHSCARHPPL